MTIDNESRVAFDDLRSCGHLLLPQVLDRRHLEVFETAVDEVSRAQIESRGIDPGDREPLIALLQSGHEYRVLLVTLLKRLQIVHEMSVAVGRMLERLDFFRWSEFAVPAVWPTLRVDLPHDETYCLNMHQDYKTTRCHRAWRLWIPLRDADEHHGTLKLIPGTQALGPLPHRLDETNSPEVQAIHYGNARADTLAVAAGDAVLFDPCLVHGSVPNRSDRTKFVLLVHVQDVSTVIHPDDPDDALAGFVAVSEEQARREM